MESIGTVVSTVATALSALDVVGNLMPRVRSLLSQDPVDLKSLEDMLRTIESTLLKADRKQYLGGILSHEEQQLISKIKHALYKAEDLLDSHATKVRLQQHSMDTNQLVRQVRALFSLSQQPSTSQQAKRIKTDWDNQLATSAASFEFRIDEAAIRKREETHSFVCPNDIIGREYDKKKVVAMLLDPSVLRNIPVVAIVGVGGLGKTTLAQLVFGDSRIQSQFPDNRRFWVCVSDQGGKSFDVKEILASILKSVSKDSRHDHHRLQLPEILEKLGEKIGRTKFLLVLDDVWTEKPTEWHGLENHLLRLAPTGSRIIITTRSKATANAFRSHNTHELKGLSEEDSWSLFKVMSDLDEARNPELVEMGKDIVRKCANVPLPIKVIGSLLYHQRISIWQFVHKIKLAEVKEGDNEEGDNKIMEILKFSYYYLSLPLKNCFVYCALFPKDFEIPKQKLISLWIAQGYVKDNGESTEDLAESYFNTLVLRCFFQNLKENLFGEMAFQIHDLMHDVAQQVAGNEIVVANSATKSIDENARHLSDDAPNIREEDFIMTGAKVRSYIQCDNFEREDGCCTFPLSHLLEKWRSLRALDLSGLDICSLPDSIGNLLHLRYLNLSGNLRLSELPESFTKLINLETLNFGGCSSLEKLPNDFNKLEKLRILEICEDDEMDWCGLSYMPRMEKLTCLRSLNGFIVAERKSGSREDVGGLEDLRALEKLRGSFKLWISYKYMHASESGGGEYLSNKEHVNCVSILFPYRDERSRSDQIASDHEDLLEDLWPNEGISCSDDDQLEDLRPNEGISSDKIASDEDLLEDLRPNDKLKDLRVERYSGERIPSWAIEENLAKFLPNLVTIVLDSCDGLQSLPWFGKLLFLKTLKVSSFKNLEYMESGTTENDRCGRFGSVAGMSRELASPPCFPSLEELRLFHLPKLKGWWGGLSPLESSGMGDAQIIRHGDDRMQDAVCDGQLTFFPRLSKLFIRDCPDLTTIPLCPLVEIVEFSHPVNEGLRLKELCSSSSNSQNPMHVPKFGALKTCNVRQLKTLPGRAFRSLKEIHIVSDSGIQSLSEVGNVLQSCSSLQFLLIRQCENLTSILGGLEFLTALESLCLHGLPELRFEEEGDGTAWRCLGRLRLLELVDVPRLVDLPKGIKFLTALHSLKIRADNLQLLPEWIGNLSSLQIFDMTTPRLRLLPEAMRELKSLQQLNISCSEGLLIRCSDPDGDDWPKIQHIPKINTRRDTSYSREDTNEWFPTNRLHSPES